MEEWQIRQEIYHRVNKIHDDDLYEKDIEHSEDIVGNAVRYFNETDIGWIYPAKSYMVGICYARWLAEHFGGRPLDYLNNEEMLYGNDPYFVPYDKDSRTYILILHQIGGWEFDCDLGMVPDVRSYF